jgi:hypothetical protein
VGNAPASLKAGMVTLVLMGLVVAELLLHRPDGWVRRANCVSVLTLALQALSGCYLELDPGDRPVTPVRMLGKMTIGGTTTVRYRSTGCFHAEDRTFVLTKTAAGASVYIGPNLSRGETPIVGRTLELSENEVSDLDNELDHHRTPVGADCTTEDEFFLAFRNNGDVREEHFIDRSCSEPHGGPKSTRFLGLARRARFTVPYARL